MEIEKQVIKTYSRRQPVTRYESRALLVPTHVDLLNCRESRINDRTLVVDNFDDTFDRLATGVVIPPAEDSLNKNGDDEKRDSDVFGVFKMPLQAQKKTGKPKQKGKPKKKDLVTKTAAVKRKNVDVVSDDSDDQVEITKKNKKPKDKVKKVIKKKKDLSPVKTVNNSKVSESDSADENVPDNIETNKEQAESDDKFKKPQENSVVNQLKISQYFQASTPRVNRIQANIDMQNISPVVMDKNDEKNKDMSVQEIPVENVEGNENSCTSEVNNFVKPRESLKVQQLKASGDLLTSTPRINKVRKPVNLQNLSPIILDKEKRITGQSREQTPEVDENRAVESNFSEDVHVPSDQVAEPVKSLTKLGVIQEDDVDGDCTKQDDVEENGETLTDKESSTSQSDQQESVLLNVTNEKSNDNGKTDGNSSPVSAEIESMVDNREDSLAPTGNKDLHGNTQNFAPSPLLFDDSECVQNQVEKNNTVSENVVKDVVDINFSQNFVKESEENKKDSSANVESAAKKNKNFDESSVSEYYPHEWTNEYDSTYGYDQLKQNQEKDPTVSVKLDENKDVTVSATLDESQDETLTSASENTDIPDAENVNEINDVSSINNTENQSVDDQDKTEEDDKTIEDGKSESDEQEKSHKDVNVNAQSIFCSSHEDNYTSDESKNESNKPEESQKDLDTSSNSSEDNQDSTITENTNLQASEVVIESRQSYPANEGESLIFDLDESIAKSNSQDLNDDSLDLPIRPSKRRKTETSEIMIFNRVDDDGASMQQEEVSDEDEETVDESVVAPKDVDEESVNTESSDDDGVSMQQEEEVFDEVEETVNESVSAPKDVDEESLNTESSDDTSLVEPLHQSEEIIEKLQGRECRIVIERIKYEDYKSKISSQRKPVKRRSTKRVSRKSSESDSEVIPKSKRSEKTRLTRRSITEDKMRQLYLQYQCKKVSIFAVKLEDQKIDLLPRRSLKRKSRENSLTEDNELDSSLTNGGLSEFLAKFNDPMKVTARRKTHKRYDRNLAAITEDQANLNSEDVEGRKTVTWGNDKRVTFNSEDAEDENHKSQPIFLKPGKSWARSLSIINHFHNGKNLDELAAGRENWRHSVQTVLNMQPEVSARSSSHEQSQRESRVSRVSSHRQSKSMRKSSIATNSRSSMRIIPGGKRSTLTDELLDSQRISHVTDRSRVSRKTSLKIRRDTLIETEDDLIKSAKDIILKRCKQTTYEPFDVCFPDSYIDNCRKIGEGVYGEVFLYENGSEKSVIKIIPIEGDQFVNCEPQKKFHEILSEIIIAEELHKLRFDGDFHTNGFVEVNRIKCVFGKYPKKLINLWYAYDEQKQSENDCPSMFDENQLYIILELAHGGQDLEAYQFQNASESYSIFLQTALTLAVAEQSLEFEHRDLHWGNLLISKTEDKESTYKLGSGEISLVTKGVKVAVIDFTLSRMSYQGCKIFNDLAADPTLFEAQGEYQFDIYRMMRDNVNDDWQQFNPFTNVLWMDYTLDKMITGVRYKRKTTKIHKSAIDDMKALRKEIMNYSSAFDFVTNCKKIQSLFDST